MTKAFNNSMRLPKFQEKKSKSGRGYEYMSRIEDAWKHAKESLEATVRITSEMATTANKSSISSLVSNFNLNC